VKVSKRNNGAQEPVEYQVFGFDGLLNIESLPHELRDNELSIALNVYGDVTGGLRMRRGMTLYHSQISTSACQGLARFYQLVVAGTPQTSPVVFTLAQIGGTLWNVVTNTKIGSTGALGSAAGPWSVARVYDPDASGGTDCLVICTGSGGPYLFNGTTISTPSGWSDASGASYCQVSNGSLWFGGIPSNPNLLWQSQLGRPEIFGQSYTTSLPVTGLSVIGAGSQSGLVFFMTKGLGVTFGVNLYNDYYQEIPHVDGFYGRTAVSCNGIVYVLGDTNIYAFDGQNIVPIGKKVRPWIINDPNQPSYPMNGARSLSFAWYYDQFIYFAYDSGNLGYCNTYLVYHIDKQGWTVLSGPNLSAACLLDAPIVDSTPHSCLVADAQIGQVYNWDVFNGTGVNGHNVQDYVMHNGTTTIQKNITTSVLTKYFRFTTPGCKATIKSIFPEFFIDTQYVGDCRISYDYNTNLYQVFQIPTNLLNQAAIWGSSSTTLASGGFYWALDSGSSQTQNTPIASWASGTPTNFLTTGIPIDQVANFLPTANSFAFGCATSDNLPPYVFAGVSGEFIPEARVIPDPGGTY
jgi:hypothetical protein